MIPGDKNFSISRENYKTGEFGSSGNFKILLRTPTVAVGAINRIWPCCALLQNTQTPPIPHTVLWIHNSTHTQHSLNGDYRLCGPHG